MRIRRRKARIAMANEAIADATKNLRKTKEKNPEVYEVARALRILRDKNHFTEHLEVIMGGPR